MPMIHELVAKQYIPKLTKTSAFLYRPCSHDLEFQSGVCREDAKYKRGFVRRDGLCIVC